MWILESNGDFLQGKRMWLKPGQKYLFGRVKREGVHFAIDHKTVSRKHFVIQVDPVADGDAARLHVRSCVHIQDQNSKSGTSVNGELIKNASRELKSLENSVRPGSCPHEIVIRWEPCNLTVNLLKKEVKAGLLKTKQSRVQPLDIKATGDFIIDQTTHVVASKRNTAKGLQALIAGKYLVSESYLDALDYAATPTTLSQEENLSPLELDFDTAWPDPKAHLPPPGREPTISPVEAYQPNPNRINIFQGYTFIFGDQTQFDNLLPVVTTGHGKALLFKVDNTSTLADDLLRFVHNAAGQKASTTKSPLPILVRWTGKDDVQEWTNALINETALKMDQRAIDQSEFLGAILTNDPSSLRQPIPYESTTDGRVPPPPSAASSLVQPGSSNTHSDQHLNRKGTKVDGSDSSNKSLDRVQPTPSRPEVDKARTEVLASPSPPAQDSHVKEQDSPPRPYQPSRLTQASRLKDFDDGFDPDAVAEYEDDEDDAIAFDSEADPLTAIKDEPQTVSRKRPRSPSNDPENEFAEEIDDLLPAATAFKKRKLAEQKANGGNAVDTEDLPPPPTVRKRRVEKELDVRKALDARREEAEEAAKREEEFALKPVDADEDGPANLVEVLTMDLPLRDKSKNLRLAAETQRSENWDPKWNGRKNFKGFRRKGEAPQRRGHATKVIVPLVAIKLNDFGIGDKYWDKTEEQIEREREKKRQKEARSQRARLQNQDQSQHSSARTIGGEESITLDDVEEGDQVSSGMKSTSPVTSRLQQEAAAIVEHDIDLDSPRRTRAADRRAATVDHEDEDTVPLHESHTQTNTQTSRSATASGSIRGKRTAPSTASSSASKRQKTLPVTVAKEADSEGDDSDDMKFRFGSRARRGRSARGARGARAGS
ncbi:hypothetical protein PV10_02185 [Exophiala mesophila]|uniref:FHA domain-containing protein n=1 Tax=Exophiala mesophila TaxID=212818 RepID=A0A0D2A619_EXOME|nr:uncharacterized protein PV10_02185 [Exophiala mesophila]KIV94418.1 hypothetical protein PV10_02185 [Exophiala mesophila]